MLSSRDAMEIKDRVNASIEQQNKIASKLDYLANTLPETMKERNDSIQNSIDDLSKQINSQSEEIRKLHNMVMDLSVKNSTAQPAPTTPSPDASQGTPSPTPAPNPAPGPSTAAQAIKSAQSLLDSGDRSKLEEAREGFRRVLEYNPSTGEKIQAYFGLAEACDKLSDKKDAKEFYHKVVDIAPTDPKAWEAAERFADIDIQEGNNKQALTILQSIVDKKPDYLNIDRVKMDIEKLKGASGQLH
jgi:TolA-binding protein